MPYSNQRRHNSPAFHKLHIKLLSFFVPTLILVILQENSNEWNLSLAKEGSSKKGEQELKRKKRGKTSVKKLHILRKEKKERMKFTCC
jgi:hypothetical protein